MVNVSGHMRIIKELIEHPESVSGEPITFFFIHEFDVDVGKSKFHTFTERDAAPNILQRKYCNEKGLRAPELPHVRQLYHYILEPIKNRGSGTPMCEFGELGNILEQLLACFALRKCPLVQLVKRSYCRKGRIAERQELDVVSVDNSLAETR